LITAGVELPRQPSSCTQPNRAHHRHVLTLRQKQILEKRPALLYNIPMLWHHRAKDLQKRDSTHMPTLNWPGKEAVVNHHLYVPFHLLKDVPDLASGQGSNRPHSSI
jgi:hypothetical protein